MSEFFSLDGPVFRYGNRMADMVILSFLWIVFSLPVVTMGAASTAAYYVATRRISEREGYLFRDFWTAFKREFWRVTVIHVPLLASVLLIFLNIMYLSDDGASQFSDTLSSVMLVLQYVVMFEAVLVWLYIYPIASRFDMGRKDLIKTAFFMANRHILSTLLMAVILAAVLLAMVFIFPALIMGLMLVPGIYIFITSYLFMRIFRKYRPEIDAPLDDGRDRL
jgi:uncharacterized membrane protein YesL